MKNDYLWWYKRKARRWLMNNDVLSGCNGLLGTEYGDILITNLAKTFYRMDNPRKTIIRKR